MGKLLSFAIPCYNSAEYMEHCINTVLAGGDEVEVIIVMMVQQRIIHMK